MRSRSETFRMRSAHFALYNRQVRILVVEDETALAERLTTALKAADYAVDVANDGVRAEFLGRTETYDAAILDLGLPRMDGLTLLQRWRDAGVGTPVLVLTARDTLEDRVLGLGEVVADRPHGQRVREEGGREREVHGRATEHLVPLARMRLDSVERDGTDDGERHGGKRVAPR